MTTCLRCHRPLKTPTESGLGPVCEKLAAPVPEVERDLFGYDIEGAALAARARLAEFVDFRAWLAQQAIAEGFRDARRRQLWVVRP
jgi:hypothetical protein